MSEFDLALPNVRVLSHSAVRIQAADGTVLYFDPFQLAEEPHDADVVFITHDHYDHLSPDDVAKVVNGRTAFVAPESIVDKVRDALLPLGVKQGFGMKPGETAAVGAAGGIAVEAVPAYNVEPERLGFHPQENAWVGYVVTVDGVRYYVTGDTDRNADNEEVACDVLLLPIGGTYTFDAAQAAAFTNELRPKAVVPTHYGTAVGKKEDVDAFIPLVDKDIPVVVKMEWPEIG